MHDMSGEKVVALRGSLVPGEPVPDIVAKLEELLAAARSGHLQGIAFATASRDGTNATGWECAGQDAGTGASVCPVNHALGCAVLTLGYRYAKACDA